MKKLTLLLILFSAVVSARSGGHGNYRHQPETIYICRLTPFSDFHIEAGITEEIWRGKIPHAAVSCHRVTAVFSAKKPMQNVR